MNGHTTGIPAGHVSIPTPTEYMDPFLDRAPHCLPHDFSDRQRAYGNTLVQQHQLMGRSMEWRDHGPTGVITVGQRRLTGNEPTAWIADRPPERHIPTPTYDETGPRSLENPGVDSREVWEGRRSEDVTHGEQGGNHVYTQGLTNRNVPEKRRVRSPRYGQERSDNLKRTSGRHYTRTRERRDSGQSSSPSSSRSRSRSGGRRGNHGAEGNGPEKKPTERLDKSSWDGKNRKSENGAGDGHGPPEKSAKREPARDPSPNEDDQAQPAVQAANEASPKKPGNFVNTRLTPCDGTECLETWLAHFECIAQYMQWKARQRKTKDKDPAKDGSGDPRGQSLLSKELLRDHQNDDSVIRKVVSWLQTTAMAPIVSELTSADPEVQGLYAQRQSLQLIDGVLYRLTKFRFQEEEALERHVPPVWQKFLAKQQVVNQEQDVLVE